LGRKVYVGAVVVIASALQHGPTKKRVAELATLLGASRRTLVRWRRWWSTMFAASRFWTRLRGRFVPSVDESAMPTSLLSRVLATEEPAVVMLLRLLAPVSTRPWLQASAM
jgi:predicted DNA-binding transcriptional regulator YafY